MGLQVILLFILFQSSLIIAENSCERHGYTDRKGKICYWEEAEHNEYVLPDPLCIADTDKIAVKKCVNGEWITGEVHECEVIEPEYSLGGSTFYMMSSNEESFNEEKIRLDEKFIFKPGKELWYSCRRDNTNKFLTPFLCHFRDHFTIESFGNTEGNCVIHTFEGLLGTTSCDGKHFIATSGVIMELNMHCNGYSLTYEKDLCYGMNLENSEFLSIREFALLVNIFLHQKLMNGRLFQSTTFPEVDLVLDLNSQQYLTLEETSNERPILTKLRIPEKEIVFKLFDTHNGAYFELSIENFEYLFQGFTCFYDINYLSDKLIYEKFNTMDNVEFFRIYFPEGQGLANYWCMGISIFGYKTIKSEKILSGYLLESFDQFAFYLTFAFNDESTIDLLLETIRQRLATIFFISNLMIFEISKSVNGESDFLGDILCHLVVKNDIESVHDNLNQLFEFSYNGLSYQGTVNSTTVCYETPLSSSVQDVVWLTTPINHIGFLNSTRYITPDNRIPIRRCIGAFPYGAVWENEDFSYLLYNITEGLLELINKIMTLKPLKIIEELDDVIINGKDSLNPEDYENIEKILESIDVDEVAPGEEDDFLGNITSLCNSLLQADPCQGCKNSTNNIAASIEEIINALIIRPDVTVSELGVTNFNQDYFYVFGIDVTVANISGIILYENQENYDFVYRNSSKELEQFVRKPQIVTYIPNDLLNYWNLKNDSKIVLKVYKNDNLFQERRRYDKKLEFNITSISVPLYPTYDLRGFEVPLILKYEGENPHCCYWNFKRKTWKSNGVSTKEYLENNYVLCNLSHMTPFTHLVDILKDPVEDIFWLDFITMVFSTLSIIGILGIFFTASLLKKWRKTNSTKILLQLATASFLQISLFFAISAITFDESFVLCFILGILLQYSLLVEFLWMMVIAISNWMFYKYPFRQALLSFVYLSVFCWCTPILPVSFSTGFGLFNSDFDYNICFPTTSVKLWGFVVPVFTIMAVNIVFYILLIYEFSIMWRNKDLLLNLKSSQLKSMLRNTTIFFFTLGLPWIFGLFHIILSENHYPNVFSYIFVLTAPLQGFILFVYFVLINPSVHEEWELMVDCSRMKREEDWGTKDKAINFWVRCWTCKEE